MSWTKSVFSSMVTEVGYNDETQELEITWNSGKRSAYSGVPEGMAEQLANAPSVGQMINSDIKPFYQHRYI